MYPRYTDRGGNASLQRCVRHVAVGLAVVTATLLTGCSIEFLPQATATGPETSGSPGGQPPANPPEREPPADTPPNVVIITPAEITNMDVLRVACPMMVDASIVNIAQIMDEAWWLGMSYSRQLDLNVSSCEEYPLGGFGTCVDCMDAIASFVHFIAH